jgi:hypothetical protein
MLLNPKKAQAFSFINDPDAHSNDDGEDDYED